MDERVKLVAKVQGGHEIRIKAADLDDLGQDGLASELKSQGFGPHNLGDPVFMKYRNSWVIPVRRDQ